MNGGLDRRLQSVIAAVSIEAGVPGKFLRMVPQAKLVIGLVKVARRKYQLTLAIALKAGTRHYVKDAIGTVAHAGPIAPPIHLEVVDILGVNLRSDVAGDVGIGNVHPIDHPAQLMSAAHVQHIVRHVGARHIVGDHRHAVGAARSWRVGDVLTADQSCRRDAVHVGLGSRLRRP